MKALIIATIDTEKVYVLDTLINQLGQWKIKQRAELVFMAAQLDIDNKTSHSKLAIKLESQIIANDFIVEFLNQSPKHEGEVQFEKLNLQNTSLIEVLTVLF